MGKVAIIEKNSKKKYKVGIIGTGFGSVVHFPGFQLHPSFEPVGIAGRNKSKTKKIAEKLKLDIFTDDWRELINNKDIDVISVVSPPDLHYPMVMEAIRAGKHILCEKPLSLDSSQAKEMYEAIENSASVGLIDLEFRYLPSRAFMIELINNGYLGNIFQVDIIIRNASRLNPRVKGHNWWSEIGQGGGILNALGSHYIDFLLLVFENINRVSGKTSIHIDRRLNKSTGRMKKVTADDAFVSHFDVGKDKLASLSISTLTAYGKGPRIEAYGDEGCLIMQEDLTLWGGRIGEDEELKSLTIPKRHALEPLETDTNYLVAPFLKLLDDLDKSIHSGKSLHPNFEDGYKIQQVIDAVRKSSRQGKWIDL